VITITAAVTFTDIYSRAPTWRKTGMPWRKTSMNTTETKTTETKDDRYNRYGPSGVFPRSPILFLFMVAVALLIMLVYWLLDSPR
jgi:hypothetical protein